MFQAKLKHRFLLAKSSLPFFGNEVSTSSIIGEDKSSLPIISFRKRGFNLVSDFFRKRGFNLVNALAKIKPFFQILFLFLSVSLLWVLFRSPSLEVAIKYYHLLFNLSFEDFANIKTLLNMGLYHNLFADNRLFMLTLCFIIVWLVPFNSNYFYDKKPSKATLFISGILFISSLKVLSSAPSKSFLYFNF